LRRAQKTGDFRKIVTKLPTNLNISSFDKFQIKYNCDLLQPFPSVFNKRPAALKFEGELKKLEVGEKLAPNSQQT
jgi:hypothetical protein